MYLKRLELVGFKSFATRTTLDLDPGIMVFVGPNGSGKSNLADAVRWVLGEQSLKAVRGRRSEDVIFAGSASRQPLGMAEVSLTLDNGEGRLPLPYAEVRLSRRLYRSGESEYLINGSRVRLKDITECLTHAGLGTETYCVIGQGAVEELILQRPEERRLAFESAADIRRYQLKLLETRSRLGSTEQNLTRCQDVMAELEPHLRRLQAQADRAERAQRVRQELTSLAGRWYRQRLVEVQAGLRQAEEDFSAAEEQRRRLETELAEHEAAWQQVRSAAEATERRLRELRPRLEGLQSAREALRREIAVGEERQSQLRQRRGADGDDLAALRERATRLEAEVEAARLARGQVEDALRQRREEVATARKQLQALEDETRRRRQALSSVIREREQRLARAAELERQHAAARLRAEGTARELAEASRRLQQAEEAHQEAVERRGAQDQVRKELESRARAAQEARAQRQTQQSELTRQLTATKQAALGAEREAARLEAALGQLAPGRPGSQAAVALPKLDGQADRLRGLLGERLLIHSDYEAAVAAALDGLARALVLASSEDAEALASRLSRERGRWTLVAATTTERGEGDRFKEQVRELLTGCDWHGFADDIVESPPELKPWLAGRLGRSILVEAASLAEVARRLSQAAHLAGPWQVISLAGDVARSSGEWVVGRGHAVDPLLLQERQRRELAKALEQQRARLQDLEGKLAEQQAALDRLAELTSDATDQAAAVDADLRHARASLNELAQAIARHEQERRLQQQRLEQAEQLRAADDQEQGKRAQALQACRDEATALEQRVRHQREQVDACEREVAALRHQAATWQTDIAVREAELRTSTQFFDRLAAETRLAQQAYERAISERERSEAEWLEVERQLAERRARLAALEAEIEPVQQELSARENERQAQVEIRRQLDEALARERQALRRADEEHEATSLTRQRARDELERLRREIADSVLLEVDLSESGDDWPTQLRLALGGQAEESATLEPLEDMAAARRRLQQLQRELRSLGAVNDAALEEYREMAERYQFLRQQAHDLQTTLAELRQAIADLEQLMSERFKATFERVNQAFQETFSTLFGGGAAHLVLTRPDSVLETGIDVVARPPGKRLQGLMSLSGGERSLTSVALLFALLSVNPTPFVLLDEVDAALDESNVQRFVNLLKRYADGIQFLVVTHNRASMEAGSALFGVSMEAGGVSRVLSLRLADAVAAAS